MRQYELMVILDPSLDERTVQPSLETFLNVVRTDGGSVEKVEVWGKRRLAYEIDKHVVGNLTADPELRFTPSGAAVANFTVASTPRTFDRQSGEWKDGEALFLRCNVWRQPAENVAESLTRGMRVMVSGRLRQRSFETREGEKRTVVELEVDEVGPSLRYATAKVNKVSRGSGGGGYGGGGGSAPSGGGGGGYDDPWGSAPAAGSGPVDDEPPF